MPTGKQQDAKDLLHVMQLFGVSTMRDATYGDETALIKSFIERLNSDSNMEKLNKFPELVDWTTTLEEANNDFTKIMNEKAEEIKADFVSATKIRDQIVPEYTELTNKINAHALVGTAPEFAATIEAINAQIIAYHLD